MIDKLLSETICKNSLKSDRSLEPVVTVFFYPMELKILSLLVFFLLKQVETVIALIKRLSEI